MGFEEQNDPVIGQLSNSDKKAIRPLKRFEHGFEILSTLFLMLPVAALFLPSAFFILCIIIL